MNSDDEIKAVFHAEATDILKDLAAQVDTMRQLTGAERHEAMRTFMRLAHTIKGAAAMVGAEDVEALAHALEDAMSPFVKADAPLSEEVLAAVEAAIAVAHRIVDGESLPEVVQEALRELGLRNPPAPPSASAPAAGAEASQALLASENGTPGRTEQSPPQADAAPKAVASAGSRKRGPAQGSIRVATERLDRLMAFAGELLVAQSWQTAATGELSDFLRRLQKALRSAGLTRQRQWLELTRDLEEITRRASRSALGFVHLTDEINTAMKRLRMLPLRELAPVWRRIVSDTAAKLKKEIEVTFDLGDVELDRYVLDSLRDQFMHFLRNAVDHGVEAPEERVAAGKPRVGQVLIRSSTIGTMVRLEISDDGRGLDRRRIGEAAVATGLVSAADLERMSDADVMALIFVPGFSTAKGVSRISGRGVGLDVVKNRIEELGGSVEIVLPPTLQGATFCLTLPVTLLSSKGLLVRSGACTYVLPTDSVRATRRVDTGRVQEVSGTLVTDEGGKPLKLSYVSDLAPSEGGRRRSQKLSIVVLSRGTEQLGLVVDEVVSEQELVTKRLPWNLRRVPGVSGAVVLADGSVGVALDVGYFFETGVAASTSTETPGVRVPREVRVLAVEDSATARLELAKTLSEASYRVTTAVDGEEAWQLLSEGAFDIVITDIQMPRLDGLDLTRRIRGSADHKDLPVVLVTSLASPSDIAAGAAVGADEYLVKGKYRGEDLIKAVERLV